MSRYIAGLSVTSLSYSPRPKQDLSVFFDGAPLRHMMGVSGGQVTLANCLVVTCRARRHLTRDE